jgi:ribonucleoside-diphosphate reductase alpha chain
MSVKALQDYTYYSKYARYNKEEGRRETWAEAVDRVKQMHLRRYPQVAEDIEWAFEMVKQRKVLGSQRALQFGGEPCEKKNARMYNCFEKSTKFISSAGVVSFEDLTVGQEIKVLTHNGLWRNARVVSGGSQELISLTITRSGCEDRTFMTTSGHEWLFNDTNLKKKTEELFVGDELLAAPDIFNDFDYDNSPPDERLYWAYGYVYGDGTKVKEKDGSYKYSMVRLCGDQIKHKYRFEELGFKTSSSLSLDGDFMAYTGRYLKESPNPEIDEPRLIRAFVRGYLDADGELNRNYTKNIYSTIQSSDLDHIEFIRKCFPIAGVFIVSEQDLTRQETNFGIRPYTIKFRISNHIGGKCCSKFKVKNIEKTNKYDQVWCLEVEGDHSFILENGLATGNCTSSFCDRVRFFQEAFWLLLCGSGTGFSVQKHHVDKLPNFHKLDRTALESKTFSIPDTIEGWADALGILLATYLPHSEFSEWKGFNVDFDYSLIRAEGTILASGVGKAPGPEPLKRSLEIIRKLLDRCLENKQKKLKSIDAYDIIMHASDAVLSGGVRRSATIALFSHDDEEMATAKTGNWFVDNPQRARSNNSAVLIRDEVSKEDFLKLMESIKQFGEPGFYWSDSTEQVPNPCVEIGMYPVDIETGESGWQCCNLTEINGKKIKCKEDFAIAARAASIIGTLQAGYTSFPYLGKTTEKIVEREALLGVSITGMMDNPDVIFDPEVQKEMAKLVLDTNEWMAKKIGINPCARSTCIKPAGTTSCLLGTSSGIHPHHAKRYFRRTQANQMEPVLQYFKKFNPHAVDKSVWSANKKDEVVTFCVEVPTAAKTKNDLSAQDLLEYVKTTQQNWVAYGKRKSACTQPWLSHNVSNTINVRPDEWEIVGDFIYKNRKYFAGVSLLPASGDLDYPQAPFCNVLNAKEILQEYGEGCLLASGLIVDGLHAYGDLWEACNYAVGLYALDKPTQPEEEKSWELKNDWVRRVRQFAMRYCDGNIKKCTYMLKHVNNWKIWLDLTKEYKEVDYTQFLEDKDYTKPMDTIACAGGKCELN